MKHLILLLIFQGSLDCFAQVNPDSLIAKCDALIARCKKIAAEMDEYSKKNFQDIGVATRDTIPEWMHVSTTRAKGFVMARKALSVRVNGICISHLDCEGKPFPVHYHVGWCEGRETLLNRLVNQLKYKQ